MSKTPLPSVTDHALLRYLERVRGFKFERERSKIRDICRGVENGTVKFSGCLFEVKNGHVITVHPAGVVPNRTRRLAVTGAAR